ncbi:unnamed protein product [Euphydryas editha]|uniref:Uncharacterized protein n=1 Tax=Euphydryas editha TaxID=104508 RepID=A0AAU9UVM7_EUPED|nr:unnamed protein product [Euphydryas editha]
MYLQLPHSITSFNLPQTITIILNIRTIKAVNAVKARIRRNPTRKQKIISRVMKIPARTLSRIIKQDRKLGAYCRYTGHALNQSLQLKRVDRSKRLLSRYASERHRNFQLPMKQFSRLKNTTYNKQNDKVYAHSSKEAAQVVGKVQRGHHPASVMVWWGVTKLHFCEKTSAKVYQDTVLDHFVFLLAIYFLKIYRGLSNRTLHLVTRHELPKPSLKPTFRTL